MMGKEEAGYYDIAVNLSEMLFLLPATVLAILFPKIARESNLQNKWRFTKKIGTALTGFMLPVCLLACLLSPFIIDLLYGKEFLPCIAPFLWLAMGKWLHCIFSSLGQFVASISVPWNAVKLSLLLVVINVILNYLWIPLFGTVGAAAASVSCFALLIPINGYYARKYLKQA